MRKFHLATTAYRTVVVKKTRTRRNFIRCSVLRAFGQAPRQLQLILSVDARFVLVGAFWPGTPMIYFVGRAPHPLVSFFLLCHWN